MNPNGIVYFSNKYLRDCAEIVPRFYQNIAVTLP